MWNGFTNIYTRYAIMLYGASLSIALVTDGKKLQSGGIIFILGGGGRKDEAIRPGYL